MSVPQTPADPGAAEPVIVGPDQPTPEAPPRWRWITRPLSDQLGLLELDGRRLVVNYASNPDGEASLWAMYRDADDEDPVSLWSVRGVGVACDCDEFQGRKAPPCPHAAAVTYHLERGGGMVEPRPLDLEPWEDSNDESMLDPHADEAAAVGWCEAFNEAHGRPPTVNEYHAARGLGVVRVFRRLLERGLVVRNPPGEPAST